MMCTRAEGKAYRRWMEQEVCTRRPSIKSPAALVLLNRKLFSQDKSIYSHYRMLRLRRRWMKQMLTKHPDSAGGLTCQICGRPGLQPFITEEEQQLATLDHIVDISQGGPWNDPNNFQVACLNCNHEKSPHKPELTKLYA